MKTNYEMLESLQARQEGIIIQRNTYEDINEMATIGHDADNNFCIAVNPDSGQNNAYFKICNHKRYASCTKVLRLSFFGLEAYDHKDGKEFWEADKDILKALVRFLKTTPKSKYRGIAPTSWEVAIYMWNIECGHDTHPDWNEDSLVGCSADSALHRKPNFVPLNLPMPDYTRIDFNITTKYS